MLVRVEPKIVCSPAEDATEGTNVEIGAVEV